MSTTFIFEELDGATREYLTAVRDHEGKGAPGVFAKTKDSLPMVGCIAGPIVIGITLVLTLTTMLDVIYKDPVKVALLQTGGLLVGGWLLVAGFRGKGGRNAGTWVYVDPLHLYEAFREQVTATPIDEVVIANYTHNYDSNGNYQNSVVNILLGGRRSAAVTIVNEKRAEQMVTFLNYLAWARGPEGGNRADLAPADLGGLAKYVVRNNDEPKDADDNINLNLVELDITEVPEKPEREGRAIPAFLPYVFMFAAAVVCFFVMAYGVNPVLREDAIFEAVTKEPFVEPRFLRVYLIDPRNTNKEYREQATKRLAQFYDPAITHVQRNADDKRLGAGMADVLRALSTAGQPVVSLRITETESPPGKADAKQQRQDSLRAQFADGVANKFAAQEPWGRPITLPADVVAKEPLPPLGHQPIAFVEPPEGAKAFHFDITYAYQDDGSGKYRVFVKVTIRSDIEKGDPFSGQFTVPGVFAAHELDSAAVSAVAEALVKNIVGDPLPPKNQGGF